MVEQPNPKKGRLKKLLSGIHFSRRTRIIYNPPTKNDERHQRNFDYWNKIHGPTTGRNKSY